MGLIKKSRKPNIRWYENGKGRVIAKVCSKCDVVKDLKHFPEHKKGLGGHSSECNFCKLEYMRRYRAISENKERNAVYQKKWREDNKEKLLEKSREYREKNYERISSYQREYGRRWYQENREKCLLYTRKWQRENPEKKRLGDNRRRARKIALPDDLTIDQQESIKKHFNGKCALSGDIEQVHLDHVIPLATGHGGTTYGNMMPLRADLNRSKNDRNVFEWFEENKERFGLQQDRFDAVIAYLAEINGVSTEDYRDHVYWCHENPHDYLDEEVDGKET